MPHCVSYEYTARTKSGKAVGRKVNRAYFDQLSDAENAVRGLQDKNAVLPWNHHRFNIRLDGHSYPSLRE